MTTIEYLEAVKKRLSITSDYALAARLGVARSGISQYQAGKVLMGDDVAVKVADILDIDRGKVLLDCAIERAKAPEIRAALSGLMQRLQTSFEAIMLLAAPRPSL